MLPRTKIVPHIRMWKVVLKKRKEKKSKVVDWHARYSRENYRGIRTPPFIPPWRVHFPSNKQPKELFPTMKIFLFPSGWRFGSLKRSRWRDPKEARSFFSAFERERERERSEGTICSRRKGITDFLIEKNCEEEGFAWKICLIRL